MARFCTSRYYPKTVQAETVSVAPSSPPSPHPHHHPHPYPREFLLQPKPASLITVLSHRISRSREANALWSVVNRIPLLSIRLCRPTQTQKMTTPTDSKITQQCPQGYQEAGPQCNPAACTQRRLPQCQQGRLRMSCRATALADRPPTRHRCPQVYTQLVCQRG